MRICSLPGMHPQTRLVATPLSPPPPGLGAPHAAELGLDTPQQGREGIDPARSLLGSFLGSRPGLGAQPLALRGRVGLCSLSGCLGLSAPAPALLLRRRCRAVGIRARPSACRAHRASISAAACACRSLLPVKQQSAAVSACMCLWGRWCTVGIGFRPQLGPSIWYAQGTRRTPALHLDMRLPAAADRATARSCGSRRGPPSAWQPDPSCCAALERRALDDSFLHASCMLRRPATCHGRPVHGAGNMPHTSTGPSAALPQARRMQQAHLPAGLWDASGFNGGCVAPHERGILLRHCTQAPGLSRVFQGLQWATHWPDAWRGLARP